jgi:hypothetical protein
MPGVQPWLLNHHAHILRGQVAIALAGKGLSAQFSRPRSFGMDHSHNRVVVPTYIEAAAADKLVAALDPATGRLQLADGFAVNVEVGAVQQ